MTRTLGLNSSTTDGEVTLVTSVSDKHLMQLTMAATRSSYAR